MTICVARRNPKSRAGAAYAVVRFPAILKRRSPDRRMDYGSWWLGLELTCPVPWQPVSLCLGTRGCA